MTIKQRVFIDIINQIPYGSNKMAGHDNVSEAYADELIANADAMAVAVAITEEKMNRKLDLTQGTDRWFAHCELINCAYDEVRQAYAWLLANGYIRAWEKQVRFGKRTYHGLTAKGWAIADRYIALAKAENN